MLKNLTAHLVVSLIFFSLTLGQQYLFFYLTGLQIVWLTIGKYFSIFIFFFAATFIKPFILRYFFLSFILILNFFQMAHLSYFGTQILPSEILLLFTQMHEIMGTTLVERHHILIPLALTIIPAFIGFMTIKKVGRLQGTKIMGGIFCLYMIYNPVRTFITGNTWGRQPSTRELTGMNVYLALSYFSGKLLPNKLLNNTSHLRPNTSMGLHFSEEKPSDWDHIILILGESLTPHHMSLFGYEKTTTPYLESLRDQPHFFHTIGISGGVSTDISVAFLLNMGFGDAGGLKASTGQHCLFKLAKKQNFRTHFLSSQSAQQLRYIAPYVCSSYLENYKSLEDISPETINDQAADDKVLLPEFKKILSSKGQHFTILHQRGSHGPWELRSNEKNRRFTHDNKVGHYNNSVVEFDLFMKELSNLLSLSKKKTLVIYVSDHGEAMGQDGKWGHGQLIRTAFEIPVIIMSFHQDLPKETKSLPKYVPHYNITLFLARELGLLPNHSPTIVPKDYVVYGNDIDGFAGKAQILIKPNGTYDFKLVD